MILAQVTNPSAGIADKILDQLFSSPPALVVFFVMIVALVSIPVLGYFTIQTLKQQQTTFAKTLTELTQTIATLTNTLQGSQEHANSAQENNSDNYLMIKTNFDQQKSAFDTMRAELHATQTALTSTQQILATHVVDVTNLHAQTRNDLKTNFNKRLGDAMEQALSQRRLEIFDTFSVPPDDDCRYSLRIVRSDPDITGAEILLYKAPVFRDDNHAGRLRGSGSVVNIIIDTAFPGWCYIKSAFGEPIIAGYARTRTIVIMELPDNPVKESPDVH